MNELYFTVFLQEHNKDYSFKLLHEPDGNTIAEDDQGNRIFIRDKHVYAYIHRESPNCCKLFKSEDDFFENTKFLTYEEFIQN